MPAYDYHCSTCKEQHEIVKSIKDFDKTEFCPKCKTEMSRGVPTKTSFSLKGGNWFRDGYGGGR